jgi:hypothetical protein
MLFEHLFRFVFVLYCMTVGVVLVLLPWTPGWDFMVARLPHPSLHVLGWPVLRGALSGFGLVHLVWALHDLRAFLRPPHDEHRATPPGDQ